MSGGRPGWVAVVPGIRRAACLDCPDSLWRGGPLTGQAASLYATMALCGCNFWFRTFELLDIPQSLDESHKISRWMQ